MAYNPTPQVSWNRSTPADGLLMNTEFNNLYLIMDTYLAGNAGLAPPETMKQLSDNKMPLSYLDTDGTLAANSDTKVASQKAVKTYVNAKSAGWYLDSNTWSYVSADAPSYIFRINADMTAILYTGQKIKYTQDATTKYAIITAIGSYSGGYTNITIYGGGNTASPSYAMSGNAITNPYYALTSRPFDFPMNPDTWSYIITDISNRSQGSPTIYTWYNLGSISINVPIGLWSVGYEVELLVVPGASNADINSTLSTANNSESDFDFTCSMGTSNGLASASNVVSRKKILNLGSKTQYFLNTKTNVANVTTLFNMNSGTKLFIRAVCQYL